MPFATAEDLEARLRLDFTAGQAAAAKDIVEGVEARVRVIGGVTRAEAIEAAEVHVEGEPPSPRFGAIRDVILTLAAVRFPNPESVMQKRLGADQSISFADSSEAARAFSKQELDMIRAAFTVGARGPARSIRTVPTLGM